MTSAIKRQLTEIEGQIDDHLCDIIFDAQRGIPVDTKWYSVEINKIVCSQCGLKRSIDEALNSGDGVYRP